MIREADSVNMTVAVRDSPHLTGRKMVTGRPSLAVGAMGAIRVYRVTNEVQAVRCASSNVREEPLSQPPQGAGQAAWGPRHDPSPSRDQALRCTAAARARIPLLVAKHHEVHHESVSTQGLGQSSPHRPRSPCRLVDGPASGDPRSPATPSPTITPGHQIHHPTEETD